MNRKQVKMFFAAIALVLASMCITQAQAQSWQPMTSGTTVILYGVWGSSATDVFAVGDMSTILHYDGMSWAPMAAGTEYLFACVWGSSATDVFAGGTNGAILHYNGTAWALMASSAPAGTRIESIWGSAGNDVFAVGGNGVILHYDGANWAPMVSGTTNYLSDVWGFSGSDVFAVGSFGTILHYDGSSWSAMTSSTTSGLNSVWGTSGSDVFASGDSGVLLHFDGSAWSSIITGTTYSLTSIWGSSGSDVYITGPGIRHYDGTSVTESLAAEVPSSYDDIWGVSASDIFVVGSYGKIWRYTVSAPTTTTTTIRRLCPFRRSSASEAAVQPLRSLRDSQLDTAFGAVIASMYYQNMDEITGILQDSRALRSRFNRLTRTNMPAVRELMTQGTATIEADDLLEMHEFLTDLQGRAGLQLRMDIDFILRGLESGWLLQWLGITVE